MENSTNNFKESIELSWTLIDNVLGGKKRLTRGLLRKLNELNELNEENLTGLTSRASRFSNSIFILKNTIEQAMLPDEETNSKDDQNASFIECSEPTLFLQQILQKEKNTIKQAMTDEKTNNRGDQCLELTLSPYRILQKRKNNTIEQVLMVGKEKNNRNDRDASIIECSKSSLPIYQLSQQEKNDIIEQAMLPDEETNASIIECSEPILPLQLSLEKKNTIKQATLPDEEKNSKNDDQDASIIECSKPSLPLHQLLQEEKNNIIEQAMKVNEKNAFIIECSESLPLHQLLQEEKNNAIKQAVMVDEETNSKDASIIECLEPTLPLQQISLSQKQKNNSQQAMVVEEKTHSKGDQNASIIECSKSLQQKPCSFVEEVITIACSTSQKQIQSKNSKKKKHKKKLSVILINNDSPDSHSIDVQKSSVHESVQSSSNGENIAPQMEDDVIELWSNLNTNKKKKNILKHEYNNRNKKALFVIDTKPDLKNLNCLNTEPAKKKQKLYHESDKAALTKQHNSIYLNIESTKAQSQKYKKEKKKKKKCSTLNEASSSTGNSASTGNLASNLASTSTSDSTSSSNRLREIVVDGSNVARAFTYNEGFGERGIQLVVDYFMSRGHVVKVFLPQYIRNKKYKFLERMYKKGVVVFTPSRKVLGRKITPYDDRFILEYATLRDGIVVSADQFRDLYNERPDWRNTILNRLLTPTFVGDCVMFPDDPLGRFGPSLYTFLRH